MSTPEAEYYLALPTEQRVRLKEITSTYRNLGLSGCRGCKISCWVNSNVDGQQDDFYTFVSVDLLSHYAIELNGMKRPNDQGRVARTRHEDFDPSAAAGILVRLGVDSDEMDGILADFQECTMCDEPVQVTGSTPGFKEAVIILETEFGSGEVL